MWKNITPAQIVQKKQIQMEKKYWKELKRLDNTNNITGFWSKYCEYLEEINLISPGRKLFYNMVKKTLLALKEKK